MMSFEASDSTHYAFHVSYYSLESPDDHTIETEKLIIALSGASELVRAASRNVTQNFSDATLLVNTSFKDRCFSIDFDLIVSAAASLLSLPSIKTAKEILEWIGLIKKIGLISVLEYYTSLDGKEAQAIEKVTDDKGQTNARIGIDGNKNLVTINQFVFNMAQDPNIAVATKKLLNPIVEDKFNAIKFGDSDHRSEIQILRSDAEKIIRSCNQVLSKSDQKETVEIDNVWLAAYSPVYDLKAKKWKFKLGKDTINADISSTNMAHEARIRGGVGYGALYNVVLETRTPRINGKKSAPKTYRILQVNDYIPGGDGPQLL